MKKRYPLIIVLLLITLAGTNLWWGYRIRNSGVTAVYQSASLQETRQALYQSLAVIRVLAGPEQTRADIIDAAHRAWPDVKPFEKDGYLWVGRLGLRFDGAGRLTKVKTDI